VKRITDWQLIKSSALIIVIVFLISVILELAINNKPIYRKSFIDYTHAVIFPSAVSNS
jgi:hypothetical protein